MEVDKTFFVHIAHPLVEIEVLDAAGVERRRTAQQAVYFVAFFEQELGKKRAVLTSYSCYKSLFHFLL